MPRKKKYILGSGLNDQSDDIGWGVWAINSWSGPKVIGREITLEMFMNRDIYAIANIGRPPKRRKK